MIISHIIGGLGNQMFQYAAGRALSLERDVPLRLDIQDFAGYALHNGYELDRIFNCDAKLATQEDLKSVLGWRAYSPIRKKLFNEKLLKLRGSRLFVDTQFRSWRQIKEVPDACYLMGNWQTEQYFEKFQNVIREDFSFRSPAVGRNDELAAQIRSSMAVSLHVRRGDIAANPASLAFHGLCSLDYYRRAIAHITECIEKPTFYIFSDDISWVRENLQLAHPCHYVDHNKGAESYNDMRLMSLCQHHIIANSSFSWWGAWLNPSLEKIVIAPQRWFAADFDSSDIIPAGWQKL
ncbi:MAG TPA: alpha-1,2-fucosyltransferase [Gallionella sp.]|nr:MAG: glycosyl transferase family 11 [Gallionellales bacterium GWA2_54_124]OGT19098.1 MAG: glycosyl transferase family 11 [Gallionellales bacterium RIFOXYD12_FULL_53_10]HCI53980.1 alpha-1,2-fucosyltransferase [Gallionella sp.]